MFLEPLTRRNPDFVAAATELHRLGQIPPNSCVLDLDTLEANTRIVTGQAHALDMEVLAMTKQIGRPAPALDAIVRGGADGFVAVDMACARPIDAGGHRVGHLGHLVQVPRHSADEAAEIHPAYWTVFNEDKAAQAAEAAARAGYTQDLLARIHAPGDTFYPGHEGGFPEESVLKVAEQFESLPHARFVGVTTFPALLFDEATGRVSPTPNLATLERARSQLEAAGYERIVVNAPGTTSAEVLPMLADAGATQIEPGHGLTGTTPLHGVTDAPEDPAVLYLTEVSHLHGGRGYCFGGGLYIDPVFDPYQVTALVGGSVDELVHRPPVAAELPSPAAIDYYGQLEITPDRPIDSGDTVIFGFRVQAFFTRAFVVPISGISSGGATVEGIWTGDGRRVDGEGLS